MKFNVIKRMAKGSVEPLMWVGVFMLAVIGTSKAIGAYTEYTASQAYPFVWISYAVAVLLYWAYGYTKWNMEWEQRQIERDLKYTKTKSES